MLSQFHFLLAFDIYIYLFLDPLHGCYLACTVEFLAAVEFIALASGVLMYLVSGSQADNSDSTSSYRQPL